MSDADTQAANVTAKFQQALALYQKGQLAQARAIFEDILKTQPDHYDSLHLLGLIASQTDDPQRGVELIDQAIKIQPGDAAFHSNRGLILQKLGQLETAVASFEQAIALKPENPEAYNHRGVALRKLSQLDTAVASFDKAIALDPRYIEAYFNRGNSLKELGQLNAAVASYDEAIALNSDHAKIHNNRGNALRELGQLDAAIASFDKAIALKPDDASVRYNRGLTFLLKGDFPAGWPEYEKRWDRSEAPRPRRRVIADFSVWHGEACKGKRIIVYEEQGLGDIIQFSRYLRLLSKAGADVTFFVRTSLHRLLLPFTDHIRLIDKVPDGEVFDFQVPLLSLPAAFETTLDSIPSDLPYLIPEPALVAKWQQLIGDDGFRIGICWQGSPDGKVGIGRSVALRYFHSIGMLTGVRLISLQKNHGLDQLNDLPPGMEVELLGDDFDGGPDAFVDTAAAMSTLDLIITSDTSIAHLAGALGCPVWVLLMDVPDWRWLLDRSDSPWYPTMTLYRQNARDDWGSVFKRIVGDIAPLSGATAEETAAALQISESIEESATFKKQIDPLDESNTVEMKSNADDTGDEADAATDHARIFNHIYTNDLWQGGSGPGSTEKRTQQYRSFLQNFLRSNHIKSVLDIGCGDWQFSRHIDWKGIDYLGIDVSSVVLANTKAFTAPGIEFRELNAVADPLPSADVLLAKDVLQHWSIADILSFLPKLKSFRAALITNGFHPSRMAQLNQDIKAGDWRPVDLSRPPFSLPGYHIYWFKADETKSVFLWTNPEPEKIAERG